MVVCDKKQSVLLCVHTKFAIIGYIGVINIYAKRILNCYKFLFCNFYFFFTRT